MALLNNLWDHQVGITKNLFILCIQIKAQCTSDRPRRIDHEERQKNLAIELGHGKSKVPPHNPYIARNSRASKKRHRKEVETFNNTMTTDLKQQLLFTNVEFVDPESRNLSKHPYTQASLTSIQDDIKAKKSCTSHWLLHINSTNQLITEEEFFHFT